MPTGPRREDEFIRIFLSAYQNEFWKGVSPEFPDKTEDGGVDAVVTAKGHTLAIEHTLIEPFVSEVADLARFWPAFETVQRDSSLSVPERITRVYVPVGALANRRPTVRKTIVRGVHEWLKRNVASLPEGWSEERCAIKLPTGKEMNLTLTTEVIHTPNFSSFKIARQQVDANLDAVVQRALTRKLPKLVATEADKRILLLERQHMNLLPEQIFDEIDGLGPLVPDLGSVDEIWFVETMFLETSGSLHFEGHGRRRERVGSISYYDGKVQSWWDVSMPYPMTAGMRDAFRKSENGVRS